MPMWWFWTGNNPVASIGSSDRIVVYMAIQAHLETLRAKPLHVRKRFAFWTSFGITAIIFVFWLASFTSASTPAAGAVAKAVEKAGSPGSSLIAGVGSFFVDIKEMIFGTKKITYKEAIIAPGDK